MTVEQASIEQVFQKAGYSSSTDYTIKKMQEELLRELKVCSDRIDAFEAKYGMRYEEFDKRFNEVTQVGLFEREDDIMDWRAELIELRGIEKRLTIIAQRLVPES
ncbi:hypothetical protein [Spirosoma rhododendri]|uniref:Uncharacterized protein n=1 Tax=Spirosoma rhododendri TaxID=2728024 RepID=A0A7L5DQS7_9BACT|nr:hypothetical protein [Spirosoma rhododendri]QJD80789.1 hypothetical protein HH216_21975 [Spirosoma rhododendri]